jgi:hypothetical protein
MEICWDNLEKLVYNPKKGCWYANKGVSKYVYQDSCKTCGEPYLQQPSAKSVYCSISCGLVKNKNGNSSGKTNYYNSARNHEKKFQYYQDWIEALKAKRPMVCEECGEDRFPCLDFHHIDPLKKNFAISKYLGNKPTRRNLDIVFKELEKCSILCSNCHRVKHSKFFALMNAPVNI